MQEEIEHKTVNFAISTTKLSARTLLRGMQFLLRQYDKHASQGKQSMKRLVRQNRGVTNVEIQKTGIRDFDRYAKRYHIDYAIQKDLSCTPPRYLIFFKAQDTDALNAAFKEYSASVLSKTERPSVLAKLHNLAQTIIGIFFIISLPKVFNSIFYIFFMHGNLHGLPDPAWLRLRCHAALNPVFIRPQGCDRTTKINYHHELSKSPLPKRSGLLHIRMEVRIWNRIGSSNAETSIL